MHKNVKNSVFIKKTINLAQPINNPGTPFGVPPQGVPQGGAQGVPQGVQKGVQNDPLFDPPFGWALWPMRSIGRCLTPQN